MASLRALACFLLLSAVVAPLAEAINCRQVVTALLPCFAYLRSSGGSVPSGCCSGVRGLISTARTSADRRTACGCLKTAANGIGNLNLGLAAGLPRACGANIPYKISPSTDCTKVN